jgi:pimeloyl-ACP methyl ester carboxylesterase
LSSHWSDAIQLEPYHAIEMSSTWANFSPRITSRSIAVNGLDMHILECAPLLKYKRKDRTPLVLLLHGFPELAYSWRKTIVPLADAGYKVVAPDQRGYGRTVPCGEKPDGDWQAQFTDDISPYRLLNLVNDTVSLVQTLGYTSVAAVVGHDFGALVAGFCALVRPDMFTSLVLMSHPFSGLPLPSLSPSPSPSPSSPPSLGDAASSPRSNQDRDLAALDPPRKHYNLYYTTTQANPDMHHPLCGLKSFLRNYYHVKSGDSPDPAPHPLSSGAARDLAVMPHYYIMPLHASMPAAISYGTASSKASTSWLSDAELDVYVSEYARTGFQGGLNWYRCARDRGQMIDLRFLVGKKIDVPALFVAGKLDWGVYKNVGEVKAMMNLCVKMDEGDVILVNGAGHWVQQEKEGAVINALLGFLNKHIRS